MLKYLLFILFTWLLMFAAFSGLGRTLARLLKILPAPKSAPHIYPWLGICLSIAALSLYQLALPITALPSAILLGTGLISFLRRPTLQWPDLKAPRTRLKAAIMAAFALTIAFIALQPPYCYDTGLYHLNSIRWLNEHPIIPGLGNLHHRLGFNQLFFTLIAALNFHPFLNHIAFHCVNSFLFVLLGISLMARQSSLAFALLMGMFFIPMPLYWIASTSPDVASTLLQLVAFYYIAKIFTTRPTPQVTTSYISYSAIIAATSTVIKLSNAAYTLALAATAWQMARSQKIKLISFKRVGAFILALVVIWLVRGYVTTGYPLFPTTFGKLNTSWTVPEEVAQSATAKIKCFARLRSYELDSPLLQDWKWFAPWLANIAYDIEGNFEGLASIAFSLGGLILLPIALWRTPKRSKPLLILWFGTLAALIFWFLTAPDIRFANGMFITFFITGLLLLKVGYVDLTLPPRARMPLRALVLLCYILLSGFYLQEGLFFLDKVLILPKMPMNKLVTNEGLQILTPVYEDQPWDSDLPATPEFNPRLRLLGKDIGSGFIVQQDSQNP
jgi:hypothetical protein